MKKYILLLAILVLGMAIGWSYRGTYYRSAIAQRDTIIQQVTRTYSKFELQKYSFKIDSPKIEMPDYVFFEVESKDTIVKENKVYVQLPIQHYRTMVKDAEIFHSGIESRIDSLNIFSTTANIMQTYLPKEKKNYLALGIEASYIDRLYIPIYFQYSRMLHKNIEIYCKVIYDLPIGRWGAGIGTNVQFGW